MAPPCTLSHFCNQRLNYVRPLANVWVVGRSAWPVAIRKQGHRSGRSRGLHHLPGTRQTRASVQTLTRVCRTLRRAMNNIKSWTSSAARERRGTMSKFKGNFNAAAGRHTYFSERNRAGDYCAALQRMPRIYRWIFKLLFELFLHSIWTRWPRRFILANFKL